MDAGEAVKGSEVCEPRSLGRLITTGGRTRPLYHAKIPQYYEWVRVKTEQSVGFDFQLHVG